MEEADKDWMMIRMMGGWVFLLVTAHPDTPGQRAIKRLLLLLYCVLTCFHNVTGGLYTYLDVTWSVWKSQGIWCRLDSGHPEVVYICCVTGWERLLINRTILLSFGLCRTKEQTHCRPHRYFCRQLFWCWQALSEVGWTDLLSMR